MPSLRPSAWEPFECKPNKFIRTFLRLEEKAYATRKVRCKRKGVLTLKIGKE